MKTSRPFFCVVALAATLNAETVKDREGAVRGDRARMESDARWIYNDIPAAFEKAKQTGKPLMVVLRCVPCVSCMDIDAQVLQPGNGLDPLFDQFVCARVINANALDLSLFQFDYDVSFAVMFFNADRTIYGRFGTRARKDSRAKDVTFAGFRAAIEGALEIHRGYPGNKAALAGKHGRPPQFKTPTEIPSLATRYGARLDWEGKVNQSCVHCHMVRDAQRVWFRDQKKPMPDEWIYPSPLPQSIGLTLDSEARARVLDVAVDSPAARAGMQKGDEIISINHQPLISVADVQWALDTAPPDGRLVATVSRDGKPKELSLTLPDQWRRRIDISWRVTTWGLRGMAFGGMLLEDLSDEERASRGIGKDRCALLVKHVGQYGTHAAAKRAGFQKDDIIIAIDDRSSRMTESELIGRLLQSRFPGDKAKALVMRSGREIELALPIQ